MVLKKGPNAETLRQFGHTSASTLAAIITARVDTHLALAPLYHSQARAPPPHRTQKRRDAGDPGPVLPLYSVFKERTTSWRTLGP